ncbi:aspartate/glutamate racemase family protein [Lysobacter enzymogenes]|uniref:aspartate/glutamate racemase family protein n=1 Tax=Lysobacter enzymogenes TaxID=69 RepID=UPI001AF687C7|nr:amino acid racemase [Lysobacter enzymogenes]QQQ00256.1 amino acid racemase [Lysobacter enzymogenes]
MTAPLPLGIVACSSEGAALCYRTICAEAAARLGPHAHPDIALHGHSLADYVACLERGDLDGVGELMLSSARKLERAGAKLLICPDNTIHQAMDYVRPRSPLPWLHIADVVAREAQAHGFRRIGLTGTQWLVESEVYPRQLAALGLEYVRPGAEQRARIGRLIMDELVYGVFKPQTVAYFQGVIEDLKAQGCDAVVLGCTEIPLIIDDGNSALPTLDSTRLLARAALRAAVAGVD